MPPIDPGAPADLVLRLAGAEDIAEIADLYIATRRAALGQMPPLPETEDAVRRRLAADVGRHEIWVAEDGGIVGFAVLAGDWLESLYVGPDRQGHGIGTLLLDAVKARRPGGFGLWVFAQNSSARGFYHRHGLVELEHTDGSANAERAPDVRMLWPGIEPMTALRAQIDAVDDDLALLLARRFALTATVQGFKAQPGHQGRDAGREQAIVRRMAAHAPGLDERDVQRIMEVVIAVALDAYERPD